MGGQREVLRNASSVVVVVIGGGGGGAAAALLPMRVPAADRIGVLQAPASPAVQSVVGRQRATLSIVTRPPVRTVIACARGRRSS